MPEGGSGEAVTAGERPKTDVEIDRTIGRVRVVDRETRKVLYELRIHPVTQ